MTRLKCWSLIHLLLTFDTVNSTDLQLQQLLNVHTERLQPLTESDKLEKKEKYFSREVELPYLTLLKKLLNWKETS
jgi:hypothetical protein